MNNLFSTAVLSLALCLAACGKSDDHKNQVPNSNQSNPTPPPTPVTPQPQKQPEQAKILDLIDNPGCKTDYMNLSVFASRKLLPLQSEVFKIMLNIKENGEYRLQITNRACDFNLSQNQCYTSYDNRRALWSSKDPYTIMIAKLNGEILGYLTTIPDAKVKSLKLTIVDDFLIERDLPSEIILNASVCKNVSDFDLKND